jgi:hypothetical protein
MNETEHKHLGQLRIPTAVAVLLILLCLAGGVYGIWRWMQKSEVNTDAVAVDPPTRGGGRGGGGGGGGGGAADKQLGRVFKRDDGSIRAFSGNYWLTIVPKGTGSEMTLNAGNGDEWLNKDQQLVLKLAHRAMRGGNALRALEITEAQMAQMRAVSGEPVIPLSDEDRARLEGLVKAWEAASDATRMEAQKAVLLAVREIARKNLAAGTQAYVASIEKLRGMMSAQQLDRYRQIELARKGGNGAPPPAKPTTGPSRGA